VSNEVCNVYTLVLKEGPDGFAKIKLRARGAHLSLPSLPLAQDTTVAIQLKNDVGCWEARFTAPVTTNDGTEFRDKSD
jgi:hypothetical protein